MCNPPHRNNNNALNPLATSLYFLEDKSSPILEFQGHKL